MLRSTRTKSTPTHTKKQKSTHHHNKTKTKKAQPSYAKSKKSLPYPSQSRSLMMSSPPGLAAGPRDRQPIVGDYNPINTLNARTTHIKFARRPKIITLDATGTLLCPIAPIADLYAQSAARVGVHVSDKDALSKGFKQAFVNIQNTHPFFGSNTLQSSKQWWYLVVKQTFANAGYNLPYSQQDYLFEQIYADFGQSSHYHVFNDVIPFFEFIKYYNEFVNLHKAQLYENQRYSVTECLLRTKKENDDNNGNNNNNNNGDIDPCTITGMQHWEPVQLGILTNSDLRYQEGILPTLGLHKYIDFYVVSEKESMSKPNPLFFARVQTKARQMAQYTNFYGNSTYTPPCDVFDDGDGNNNNDNHGDNDGEQQLLNNNHNNNNIVSAGDYLHIGDNLLKDTFGALRSGFDSALLLREPKYDEILGKILNAQQQHFYHNNNNQLKSSSSSSLTTPSTPDNSSNITQDEYQLIFQRKTLRDDYKTMQEIVHKKLSMDPSCAGLSDLFQDEPITTFRHLLQVRDAFFHDIVDQVYDYALQKQQRQKQDRGTM